MKPGIWLSPRTLSSISILTGHRSSVPGSRGGFFAQTGDSLYGRRHRRISWSSGFGGWGYSHPIRRTLTTRLSDQDPDRPRSDLASGSSMPGMCRPTTRRCARSRELDSVGSHHCGDGSPSPPKSLNEPYRYASSRGDVTQVAELRTTATFPESRSSSAQARTRTARGGRDDGHSATGWTARVRSGCSTLHNTYYATRTYRGSDIPNGAVGQWHPGVRCGSSHMTCHVSYVEHIPVWAQGMNAAFRATSRTTPRRTAEIGSPFGPVD